MSHVINIDKHELHITPDTYEIVHLQEEKQNYTRNISYLLNLFDLINSLKFQLNTNDTEAKS